MNQELEGIAILLLIIATMMPCLESIASEGYDPTPNDQETSVFAIGDCAVGVITIQYIGGHDGRQRGNWTDQMEQLIKTMTVEALDGFEDLSPNGCIRFASPEFHLRVPVTYDPFSDNRTTDNEWVSEAMSYLGFEGANYYSQVQNFADDLRERMKTDWAVVVFFCDGTYAGGRFPFENEPIGYAHLGGPYFAYALPAESRLMFIHELAHCFYATDEYNGEAEHSGYLWVADNDTAECLMNSEAYSTFCQATQEQLGWRDSDGDGIHDIVDNPIHTTLDQFWPNPAVNVVLEYTGVSFVEPYPSSHPQLRDITITKVSSVQFRVDNGTWFNATPTDGRFDYAIEEFLFVTPALEPGQHTIEARGINTVGNVDEFYAKDTVMIIEGGPGTIPQANFTYSTETENVTVGQSIFFDASASSSASSISSYTWDFGDGNTTLRIDPYVSHAYDSSGKFTVMLNVTNSRGLWNITTTSITVGSIADLTGDGVVNILDLAIIANAFGSYPEHPRWNPDADIDGNEEVNILDLSMVAVDFGKSVR